MQLKVNRFVGMGAIGALLVLVGASLALTSTSAQEDDANRQLIEEGREIFRFDTLAMRSSGRRSSFIRPSRGAGGVGQGEPEHSAVGWAESRC